ncbi:hypothetical protein DL764_006483 [Monosporascus ibericus]|uniref:Lysine-specific metallo-endopeptidase domain-containing protein n=1 Tax=Monosporascus ibericus TaxID=155417 RepID=A0A4Q4T6M0_9PEZI|nr:hypothetical protein DL764_006483 [Monosporascus ibericus]
MRSNIFLLRLRALLSTPSLTVAQDDDVDYNEVWNYAPDFSNDKFPPYPDLKDESGNNITVENIRGTHLFGWKGCGNEEVNKITRAYKDFHTLTSQDGVYKNIDWAHAAAVDFWGPKIFEAANEVWSYWWSYQPPWFSWRQLWIEVRCSDSKQGSDSSDPDDVCGDAKPDRDHCPYRAPLQSSKPTLQAWSDPTGKYSKITFCNDFFNLDTFEESMSKNRPANQKKRLDKWDNQARCFLHEITHLDYFMNAGPGDENKSPYVSDLEIRYTDRGSTGWHEAYGPYNARVLTNYRDPDPQYSGYYTQRNADNYAWFALAKYVEGKIGGYPDLPRAGRKKPLEEPRDAATHGPPQRRDVDDGIVEARDEDDPPEDMPEYPGCGDRAEYGPGAAAETASISSAHEAGPTDTPNGGGDDLPEVECADSGGVRFHKSIARGAMQVLCGNKDNWDKVITPPISLGSGSTEDGKEKTWKVTTNSRVPTGTDEVWTGMLFAQDSCMGFSNFVVGKDDSEKLLDCTAKYIKIMEECSNESGWMTGGTIKDVCIVYDIRGALEWEKPYDGWYEGQGEMKCEETDTSAIGGEESALHGTCTCWYKKYEGLTEVFKKPESGNCADVDKEDIY